jgi:hypothetical protein
MSRESSLPISLYNKQTNKTNIVQGKKTAGPKKNAFPPHISFVFFQPIRTKYPKRQPASRKFHEMNQAKEEESTSPEMYKKRKRMKEHQQGQTTTKDRFPGKASIAKRSCGRRIKC